MNVEPDPKNSAINYDRKDAGILVQNFVGAFIGCVNPKGVSTCIRKSIESGLIIYVDWCKGTL